MKRLTHSLYLLKFLKVCVVSKKGCLMFFATIFVRIFSAVRTFRLRALKILFINNENHTNLFSDKEF